MMGKFKIGDRVNNESYGNGTVIDFFNGCDYPLVEFDEQCPFFHNGNGDNISGKPGKQGHCFYTKDLTVIETTQCITVRQKGRKVIAVLTDADGKFIKAAKARYNPNDAAEGKPFDFEIGKRIALKRLLGEDVKNITLSLDGKKIGEAVKKATEAMRSISLAVRGFKVVKQDRYEFGDKVKVRKDLASVSRDGDLHVTPQMMSLAGKIVTITGRRNYSGDGTNYRYSVHEDCNSWSNGCFEGKVVENTVEEPSTPSFDWQSFKAGKFAVHCDTEEKAKAFLKECDEQGIRWNGGGKASSETMYERYGSNTCYCNYLMNVDRIGFSDVDYFRKKGIEIIDYAPSKPTVKEVKRPAKVGEWIKVIEEPEDDRFKNGEVYEVMSNSYVTYVKHPGGMQIGTGYAHISEKDYVVLENYQPEEPIDSKSEPEQPISNTSMREVMRAAKPGDFIKIVNSDGNDKNEYQNGDILLVVEADSKIAPLYEHGLAFYRNASRKYACQDEYVVLENFDYSVFPRNEPFRKAKVGDKIKVVKVACCHTPEVKVDDIQNVDIVRDTCIGTKEGNVYFDYNQEYIIIEEAKVEADTKPEDTEIKVGDTVKVVDNGKSYTTYRSWFSKYEPELAVRYAYETSAGNGTEGKVVAKHVHENYPREMVCAVETIDGRIFLVEDRGLAKIK